MLAPSEKHLEDWLYQTPNGAFHTDDSICLRQYALPSGIVDLLYLGGKNGILIVELKKGLIDTKAIVQTMRYIRDIKEISRVALNLVRPIGSRLATTCDPEITAMIIGSGIKDEKLTIACELCNIDLAVYDYDLSGDSYSFVYYHSNGLSIDESLPYATDAMGQDIQQGFLDNVEENHALEYADYKTINEIHQELELYRIERDYGITKKYEGEL